MSKPDPNEPEVMSASEVRQHFSEVVNRVARGEGRIIVEKNGAPSVGVVSLDDLRRLRNSDDTVRRRTALVESIREKFADIPDDELEREIEKAFEEMRQERRARKANAASIAS